MNNIMRTRSTNEWMDLNTSVTWFSHEVTHVYESRKYRGWRMIIKRSCENPLINRKKAKTVGVLTGGNWFESESPISVNQICSIIIGGTACQSGAQRHLLPGTGTNRFTHSMAATFPDCIPTGYSSAASPHSNSRHNHACVGKQRKFVKPLNLCPVVCTHCISIL